MSEDEGGPSDQERALAVESLTPRQIEILQLVLRGFRTKEIARELGLAPDTVDIYISRTLRLLGVPDRREAARLLAAHMVRQTADTDRPNHQDDLDYRASGVAPEPPKNNHKARSKAKLHAGIDVSGAGGGSGGADRGSYAQPSGRRPRIPIFVTRYLLDVFYVVVFFVPATGVAYGIDRLVDYAKSHQMGATPVLVLHVVADALVMIDGFGVVTASTVLTYRFIRALIRAPE